MKENTNRAIAYNSLILYVKMAFSIVCGFLTTRFALQALGIVDYGLYSVLGSIISFISIFNTIMLSSSNRFIAVALGKGDEEEVNKQFNVNLAIHTAIALIAILVAIPIGDWYISRYVNYDGPLSNAMMVYVISVVASIMSFVGVPYNGLLMAKEKFIVFSVIDVILHIFRLVVAWLLVNHFEQKLFIYTMSMGLSIAITTLIYMIYCNRHYHEIVRFRVVRDKQMYKNIFNFSSWVAVGAVTYVARGQGAALIVNSFFSTVMNTAMGLASSVNQYVSMFAGNIIQPMQPQITKSYAAGNTKRTDELLIMSTKYSFLFVLLLGSFFFVEPDWLLGLWLGEVPPYTTIFLVLLIINNLVESLNSGVSNILWANGNIRLYQVCVSSLNLAAIILGYMVLRNGADAYFLLVAYIAVSIIKFFVIQWVLRRTLNYDNGKLWKHSYFPSIIITVLYLPVLFLPDVLHPIIKLTISFCYILSLIWFIGFKQEERIKMLTFFKGKFNSGH